MALIIDPDDLATLAIDDASTPVFINTSALTIKLKLGRSAVYRWRDDEGPALVLEGRVAQRPLTKNLAAFPFPLVPITDEPEFVEGGTSHRRDTLPHPYCRWTRPKPVRQRHAAVDGDHWPWFYRSRRPAVLPAGRSNASTNVQLQGQVNQAVQKFCATTTAMAISPKGPTTIGAVSSSFVREQGRRTTPPR